MEVENDVAVEPNPQPPDANGASGLVLFISNLIEDPMSYTANGEILLSKTMIKLIRVLIQTERQRQEADKKRDEQIEEMASQIKTILNLQQSGPAPTALPPRPNQPRTSTYADLVATRPKNLRQKPAIPPPARDLRMLRPGKAVIHSNPLNNQLDKLPNALFVQRANEALAKMNARIQDELVTVTGADVMPSGDVFFYTKNRIHEKWLMENKHLWSKHVHADLEATPSA